MLRINLLIIFILIMLCIVQVKLRSEEELRSRGSRKTTISQRTRRMCVPVQHIIHARHKSCFLRPDTGPCRADLIQWYFDVKQGRCYRFYWGGCQGNGNRFETRSQCIAYCHLNETKAVPKIPYFCSLSFDYGTCFGYYNRWTWEKSTETCKKRLYSGCGGNQNNFQTYVECVHTCVKPALNTLVRSKKQLTTCIPVEVPDDFKVQSTSPSSRKDKT